MSKLTIAPEYLARLAHLDDAIRDANNQKIKLIFKAAGISCTEADLARVMEWELITVAVPDKQMAVQLNKLSAYIPNLKFVVDSSEKLFTLGQGVKRRRVWKER